MVRFHVEYLQCGAFWGPRAESNAAPLFQMVTGADLIGGGLRFGAGSSEEQGLIGPSRVLIISHYSSQS